MFSQKSGMLEYLLSNWPRAGEARGWEGGPIQRACRKGKNQFVTIQSLLSGCQRSVHAEVLRLRDHIAT